MISGESKQSHRVTVHVRVEQDVEAVQGRQRARRSGVVLCGHQRSQQMVHVLGSIPEVHPPCAAFHSAGAERRGQRKEALGVGWMEAFLVGGKLWVVDAERAIKRRPYLEAVVRSEADRAAMRGGGRLLLIMLLLLLRRRRRL